jgi:hypothetical protein
LEKFSRHTTCIPARIKDGGWDSVGVVELPADPECDEVPTPELKDSDSTRESFAMQTANADAESNCSSSGIIRLLCKLCWSREFF